MTKPSPGDPQIDIEFGKFLKMVDSWDKKKLDNLNSTLLKQALEKIGSFKGRLDGAVMTNTQRQIGALKGEVRKSDQ